MDGRKLLLLLIPAVAAVAAACGDNEAQPSETLTPTQESADASMATATPTPEGTFPSFMTADWPNTDFNKASVDPAEIRSGGVGKDTIPALDAEGATSIPIDAAGVARFITVAEAGYNDRLPVAFLEVNGDARAYPLHVLTWHEVVNDIVGGKPVVATFCPLCNTALAFERSVGGRVLDFGVSGNLRNSDLIMYDRQTESWWQQATGEAIVGELTGELLTPIAMGIMSWGDWKRGHPDGTVLSENTELGRAYGINPYAGYDSEGRFPFLFDGNVDERLDAMERVVGLEFGESSLAVPYSSLSEHRVANVGPEGGPVVVFWTAGTASALAEEAIEEARDVGAAIGYVSWHEGQRLTFVAEGKSNFVDEQTGSVWDITGKAISGPLAGAELELARQGSHFWFAWAAFEPETDIWSAP